VIFPAILAFATAAAVLFYFVRANPGRTELMRKFAARRGLDGPSFLLPADFPRRMLDELYSGWVMPRWSGPHNVIAGADGQDLILAFDITVQRRKGVYRRTVIARRCADFQPKSKPPKGYVYRASSPWQMLSLESGHRTTSRLIDPPEIERVWELLK